jgi:hypothetical protein
MSARTRIVALAGSALAIAFVVGLSVEYVSCKKRGAAFTRQVDALKRDAQEQLKVGASKIEVARFFNEHRIRLTIEGPLAHGYLRASGCAIGCGAAVIIEVHVELDAHGAVAQEAAVDSHYTDCM